jgi:hypothetical protein
MFNRLMQINGKGGLVIVMKSGEIKFTNGGFGKDNNFLIDPHNLKVTLDVQPGRRRLTATRAVTLGIGAVFIPKNYRGPAFITFENDDIVQSIEVKDSREARAFVDKFSTWLKNKQAA